MNQLFPNLSDQELIVKCTQRSPDWGKYWQEFEKRYGKVILLFLMRELTKIGGDKYSRDFKETVKDLRQDVYIKLLREKAIALRDFKGEYDYSFIAYLHKISINTVINFVKLNVRGKRSPDKFWQPAKKDCSDNELEPDIDNTQEELEVKFFKQNIIASLKESYPSRNIARDLKIFKLFYFEELSADEIFTFHNMNLSVSGIETLLSRMKNVLKEFYFK